MQRRTFLAGAAAAGLVAAASPATAAVIRIPSLASEPLVPQDLRSPGNYARVTADLRQRYWTAEPERFMPAVTAHARAGAELMRSGAGPQVASAVAETALLASRIAFFDLRLPDAAVHPWHELALAAADEAGDHALAVAVLGHMSFVPAWAGRGAQARGLVGAARRRATGTGPVIRAWLDAIHAEHESRLGAPEAALPLLDDSARTLAEGEPGSWTRNGPEPWLDWFSAARLEGFRGNAELALGRTEHARTALEGTLRGLGPEAVKQRAVTLADLAAADAVDREPRQACENLHRALDVMERQPYATAAERVRKARAALGPWAGESWMRELDDRIARVAPPSGPASSGDVPAGPGADGDAQVTADLPPAG